MDTDYAWAAGFIDGEGTITLKRYFRYGKVISYQPYITCTQADSINHFLAIERLQKLFGGSLARSTPKPPRLPTLQWTVVSSDALKCIELIRPYLKIKHTHSDILLRYSREVIKGKGYHRIPDEETKKREGFWNEMRLLNERGTLRLQRLSEQTPKGEAIV